jgi:hypothetical protein
MAKRSRRNPRVLRDPAGMSAAQLNRELDRVNSESLALNQRMIDEGRGHERPSEYLRGSDPLALLLRANYDRRMAIVAEIERRAGPGMRRAPRGFGPLRNPKGIAMATKRQAFIATRSKAKALRDAKKRGLQHPIAVKAPGGFVVYEAYHEVAKSNPRRRKRKAARKRVRKNPDVFPLFIRQSPAAPWVLVGAMRTKPWAIAIARRLNKTGLGVKVTDA